MMVSMYPISEIDVANKTVLVRGDLDVAIEGGVIQEDYRLKALLPTFTYLRTNGAKVVMVGHLGRPEGKHVTELSLRPIGERLHALLGEEIVLVEDWFDNPETITQALASSDVLLLENIRFDPREEANDPTLAQILASCADIFVNESFATAHRAHASTVGVAGYLPSYLGIRFAEEIAELTHARENPAPPLVLIMGGGKAETKVPLVKKMASFADTILLGGTLMFAAELEGVKGVRFPRDAVRVDDIGPESVADFTTQLAKANTIVWNGPVGRFEQEEFRAGTQAIAEAVVHSSARTIIGGGDTIAALNLFGVLDKIDFVSIGGGAMLDFLAEGDLPGLKAVRESH